MKSGIENRSVTKKLIVLLLSIVLAFLSYTFLHEMGHGVIGLIAGGHVVGIDLGFNAHISIMNASYNEFTLPLMNVFGFVLPVILVAVLVGTYSNKVKSIFYHFYVFFLSVITTFSSIPWVVIPFIYRFGSPPQGDDVTRFLQNSGLEYWIVSLFALGVLVILVFVAIRIKKVHINYLRFSKELRSKIST